MGTMMESEDCSKNYNLISFDASDSAVKSLMPDSVM